MMLVNLAGNHSLLTSNICDALRNLEPFLQFKNVKNTHGGALVVEKLQTQSHTPPWVVFTFLN